MALYSNLYAYIDGALLAENQTLTVSLQPKNQEDIISIGEGYLGTETGAHVLQVEGELAVPLDGTELNVLQLALYKQKVQLFLSEGGSGQTLTSVGYILSPTRRAGVGQNQVASFSFRGTPAFFE